jgi:hypothetical protein
MYQLYNLLKTDFFTKELDGTHKKLSRGKTKGIEGEWRPRSRKHRFVMLYDKRLNLKWEEQTWN